MRIGRKGQRFFFVDFETEGLDVDTSGLVEIGIVVTDEWFNVLTTYEALLQDPDGPLAHVANEALPAYRVHGITEEARAGGKPLVLVAAEVEALAKRCTSSSGSKPVLVSDCVQFEWQLMRRLLATVLGPSGKGTEIRDVFHFCAWDTRIPHRRRSALS